MVFDKYGPALAWLAENGIDPGTVAFDYVIISHDGTQIIYHTCYWDDDKTLAQFGGILLNRQTTVPLKVPPPRGLVDAMNRAVREDRIARAVQDLVGGLEPRRFADDGFVCVHCDRISYLPKDKANRYCPACHHFCDDVDQAAAVVAS